MDRTSGACGISGNRPCPRWDRYDAEGGKRTVFRRTGAHARPARIAHGSTATEKAAAPRADEPLLAALKALRFRIAQEQGVPAYIVFSNATLLDMAAKQPCSMEELMDVSGVGHVKAERYGAAFLHEISRYTHTHKEEL